jgi:hypothetical protein
VTRRLTRTSLLRRGAAGGGALLLAGPGAAALARPAVGAVPDGDLAYLRLLIGVELLAVDFHTQALASGKLGAASTPLVKKILADEKAHYAGLAQLVTGAGQIPATADDIDFAYPKNTFSTEATILKAANTTESIALGAYLGAIESVQSSVLRLPIGQIAANEAQHLSAVSARAGRRQVGRPFAAALDIDAASSALDVYES